LGCDSGESVGYYIRCSDPNSINQIVNFDNMQLLYYYTVEL